jgi:hypothetical protein
LVGGGWVCKERVCVGSVWSDSGEWRNLLK